MEGVGGLHLAGLRESLRFERSWTPVDFKTALRAQLGSAFGPSPTLLQSAYFRQPNRDRRVKGLYHVGAGTHPGAGIPGVLMGAEVTAQLLLEEARAWRS
jgi:phytoene desaturase